MSAILSVTDLRAGYGRREIIHGVSLALDSGGCSLLLGTNGAGKSTLLGAIAGRVQRMGGTVRVADADLPRGDIAASVAAGVQLVPEGGRVFRDLSVHDNLRLGAFRDRKADISKRVERVVDLFPILAERMSQRGGTLSGGERQMLAIGRALMAEPKVLLLDEPFLGLAPLAIDALLKALQAINVDQGIALLVAEQDLKAVALAQRTHILSLGEITVTEEDASELLKDDARAIQEQFFGG